eukprot:scaffold278830_cov37-Prasinocladus_malaysianus.AAC.1
MLVLVFGLTHFRSHLCKDKDSLFGVFEEHVGGGEEQPDAAGALAGPKGVQVAQEGQGVQAEAVVRQLSQGTEVVHLREAEKNASKPRKTSRMGMLKDEAGGAVKSNISASSHMHDYNSCSANNITIIKIIKI